MLRQTSKMYDILVPSPLPWYIPGKQFTCLVPWPRVELLFELCSAFNLKDVTVDVRHDSTHEGTSFVEAGHILALTLP